jgi:hypothetical protein
MDLTVTLSRNGFTVTALESAAVLDDAYRMLAGDPQAIIVALTGEECAEDIAQFGAAAAGRAIFLAPKHRAAYAGNTHSPLLSADAPSALIVATLVALLAGRGVKA